MERFFLITPGGLEQLLGATEVTSIDYNNVKALVQGEVDTFMGFKFVMIADCEANDATGALAKTGLPKDATSPGKRLGFAFHKSAVGYGVSIDKTTHADWVANKAAFLIQTHLLAGAVAIDPKGIVAVQYKDDVIFHGREAEAKTTKSK